MSTSSQSGAHSAEASALGFYYQALYALLLLFEQNTDNAAVSVEALDDVQLSAAGDELLYQLKHSLSNNPSSTSIKSKAVWRTMKSWIDVIPEVCLTETTFHLITVGSIVDGDPLATLLTKDPDRPALIGAMTQEANRVRVGREQAQAEGKPLPYADRADGCEAFLKLSDLEKATLCARIRLIPGSPDVTSIEGKIANGLKILPSEQRSMVAKRLVEWWNRELVYSLCGKRERVIKREELQNRISSIVAELERDALSMDFEQAEPPADYQPDGMLTLQIQLVKGLPSDVKKAIREEWRAREQRSVWLDANAANAMTIGTYDRVLKEHWSDRHTTVKEESETQNAESKEKAGLDILRWSHNEAPNTVRPIDTGYNGSYYVRGSLQILAVNLEVGWHPDYEDHLKVASDDSGKGTSK
ncbi:hypothetical protein P8936_06310 [Edaphobacter paludis]|uniref:ABC-three component systems C-terminal domain-containing protein n=1 Tax=Edaphobacter paludis TaxID=3035702 RepID=A0AAU7DBM2_9BACT